MTTDVIVNWPILRIYASPIDIVVSVHGETLNIVHFADPINIAVSVHGNYAQDVFIGNARIDIIVSLIHIAAVVEAPSRANWVKWSKIGRLDFTIDESIEAGERPLDWKGFVYGQNGVSILNPSGVHYGMRTIYRIGVICKPAVAGTDDEHYFIDQKSRLLRLTGEGLQMLDYSEYISQLSCPKLSLDPEFGLLYICDGTKGYVYSTKDRSLGLGPANVTDINSQTGDLYVVSPAEIEIPKFDITTDIYDLGTRKPKTIKWIEIGTDLTGKLEAMIESRIYNDAGFNQSKWALVNPNGIAYITCYGVEFKFNIRSYIYEYLELDYINVTGVIHGFSYLESVE